MEKIKPSIRYFAAANSGKGFVSFFDEIFDPLDRLYIIKGGSGTGKSRMMGDIASAAENRGLYVERYYCSADAGSLDGVVIPSMSLGIMDGTAPHTRDPKYPGAVDEIINVGQFWDAEKLRRRKDDIRRTVKEKSEYFGYAFKALNAAALTDGIIRDMRSRAVDTEKLDRVIQRLARNWESGRGYRRMTRVLDAYTMRGEASLNTFAEHADRLILVSGKQGAASAFLSRIERSAAEKELEVVFAPDVLDVSIPVEIYLPEQKTAFVRDCGAREPDKVINTDRFVCASSLKTFRSELTSLEKRKKELKSDALRFLAQAAERHFSLEEIYAGAMDFYAKEELTRKLISGIFG